MQSASQHHDAKSVSETTDDQAVGRMVRAIREGAGLTVGQLARLADMAPQRLGRIEHGAKSYGVEREEIATGVGIYTARHHSRTLLQIVADLQEEREARLVASVSRFLATPASEQVSS